MLKAIERLGFEQAAPIQAEAIPVIQSGRDVVGQSQTGSGKTAAFAIPAIEKVKTSDRAVQVLILCPTRELAVQVSEEVHKLACFKPGIRALPIYGGQSYDRQYAGLRAGANIVIGTPGRVMDHMQRGTLKLDRVHTVILDEADEMLDMGFREDIEFILKAVPVERQTVLFSATVPRPIEELIRNYTRDAVRVRIEAKALTVPTVEQVYFEVDRRWKIEALTRLIEMHNATLGIIFCNTQRMVDELSEHLQAAGYSADALHGGMAQAARDRVMKKFRTGGLEFLVATDVAARGIDVDDVQVVFNFDLPYDAEDYVHRIGRTGRAGRSGIAITFVSGREFFLIREIERFTKQRIRRGEIPSQSEIERVREDQLIGRLRTVLAAGGFPRREHLIEALLEEGFDSVAIAGAAIHLLTGGETAEAAGKEGAAAAAGVARPPKSMSGPAAAPAKPLPPAVPSKPSATAPVVRKSAVEARKPATEKPVRPAPTPAAASAPAPTAVELKPEPVAEVEAVEDLRPAIAAVIDEEGFPAIDREPAVKKPGAPVRPRTVAAPVAPPADLDEDSESNRPGHGMRRDDGPARTSLSPRPEPPVLRSSGWDRPTPVSRSSNPSAVSPPGTPRPEPTPRTAPAGERPTSPRPVPQRAPMPERPPERNRLTREDVSGPEVTTTLWVALGHQDNVTPEDVMTCIQGHTGLPPETVGEIEIHEKHSFVNVSGPHARGIVTKLNHGTFRGKRLRARLASQ